MSDGEERGERRTAEADGPDPRPEPREGQDGSADDAAGERATDPAESRGEGWADRSVAIPLPGPRADETDEPARPLPPPGPRRPIPLPPPLERPGPVETRRPPTPAVEAAEAERSEPPPEEGRRGPRADEPGERGPESRAAAGAAADAPSGAGTSAGPAPSEPAAAPEPTRPQPAPPPFDAAALAAASVARSEEEDLRRSYREVVQQVERYVADGYDPIVLVGYPTTGKTHGLKALSYVLRGFEEGAREELQRDLAPGPTEQWPFYRPVASPQGARWVFVDPGGELYARLRQNDWTYGEGAAGLFHTLSRCRALLLMIHLKRGHLDVGPTGFGSEMTEAETKAEREVQKAHEELGFLDQFLLFVRALRHERADVERFLQKVARAPSLDAALREYGGAPRLDVPVAVLFTQADRLTEGKDFMLPSLEYLTPQAGGFAVAPFVARNLPGLFASLLRHARRFKLDFVQSYVERPAPGGERPVWHQGQEHLSVGLLPAVEFLERNLPPRDGRRPFWDRPIDTRTALKIHRLLHPALWRGGEVDF